MPPSVHNELSMAQVGEGEIGLAKSWATRGGGPVSAVTSSESSSLLMSSFIGGPIGPPAMGKKVARTP